MTHSARDGAGGNVKALRHPRKLKPHAPRCGDANGARRRSLRMVRGYPVSINAHIYFMLHREGRSRTIIKLCVNGEEGGGGVLLLNQGRMPIERLNR